MKAFGWSLRDIDETDIQSLMAFMGRFGEKEGNIREGKRVYCDEVDWL